LFSIILLCAFISASVAPSVERIEAFLKIGRKDPVSYAEVILSGEVVPRTWEEVLIHVKPILTNHKK
jgi:hypothetical protein